MSSSGGSDAKKLVDNAYGGAEKSYNEFGTDPIRAVTRVLSDISTGSFARYDIRTGKWSNGTGPTGINESLGEITGRNAARKASFMAQDKLRAEEAQANLDQQRKQLQAYRADLSASNQAQALQTSAAQKDRAASFQSNSQTGGVLGNEKDFLGL